MITALGAVLLNFYYHEYVYLNSLVWFNNLLSQFRLIFISFLFFFCELSLWKDCLRPCKNLKFLKNCISVFALTLLKQDTVEPRFNEPLFNEVLDITNDIISMSRPKLQ